jgi:ribosomal protein S27AE
MIQKFELMFCENCYAMKNHIKRLNGWYCGKCGTKKEGVIEK